MRFRIGCGMSGSNSCRTQCSAVPRPLRTVPCGLFVRLDISAKKLPRLIAVGNGPEESDAFSIPSLSVVYLPMEDMARECIQLVLGQLDGRIATAESRLLPISIFPGESCGPLTEYAAQ